MEQGAHGHTAGLACVGKIPVFCAIAPAVTCRNFEMFRNDLRLYAAECKSVRPERGFYLFYYSDLGPLTIPLGRFRYHRMIPGVTVLAL